MRLISLACMAVTGLLPRTALGQDSPFALARAGDGLDHDRPFVLAGRRADGLHHGRRRGPAALYRQARWQRAEADHARCFRSRRSRVVAGREIDRVRLLRGRRAGDFRDGHRRQRRAGADVKGRACHPPELDARQQVLAVLHDGRPRPAAKECGRHLSHRDRRQAGDPAHDCRHQYLSAAVAGRKASSRSGRSSTR